jgi:general secretion pathway protein B
LQAEGGGEKQNPDDYAPAVDPGPAKPFANRVTRATASGVPLYQDVAAANSQLPNLRLDLHVYTAAPQGRFVMINMRTMHEGDSLPNGVRVESITPEGAVLSQNGTKFLLPRQ